MTGLGMALAMQGGVGSAQPAYPARQVRVIVPFPPGGGADFMGREIARRLSEALGQPFVVENRAGAAGIIGSELVAKAPADGYTLLLATTGTHSSNPVAYKDLPYHPLKDFSVVSIFADAPFMLCVNAGLNINSFADLIAYSKLNPKALTYGSAGLGSSTHLGFEALKQLTGIQVEHVPYKGLPPAMADTLSGHVSMTFDSIPSALPHLNNGRIRVLGVGSAKRLQNLPNVPTIAEAAPGYTLGSWYGLLAPAGTPADVVRRLNGEVNRILQTKEFQERLAGVGATPLLGDPAQHAAFLAKDLERWLQVASSLNLRASQ
ncbi:MAG: tripartite tricarboxylate transporter substrate binding protein [Burkholderiales bacterium]|nr:tripartite tricarboxylate transporter substrate binding protein [Burkholderiales bacterium]